MEIPSTAYFATSPVLKHRKNVEALIASFGDDIDCIIADNDDEALGAIAALQAHGYFTSDENTIPVVGVDATAAGCEAIKNGTSS